MKQKLVSLAFALALLAGTVSAAAFVDVDQDHYYAQAVAWAVEKGITTGTTESTFSPNGICTRGQILTFLWRAAGSPEPESTESPFDDVTPDLNPDFYKAFLWAAEQSIISDQADGSFFPNNPCSRGDTTRFLWRYAGSPKPYFPAEFDDVPPNTDYAEAVGWAVENGITSGVTETSFSLDAPCTRGQIVTFLYRSLGADTDFLEVPAHTPPAAPQQPEQRPLQTLTGDGYAYSLGLDGSEFTSENAYESTVQVDIYSDVEAVLTVQVPSPLFQAWDYSVRFASEDVSYLFTYSRWDEAFADMVSWTGDHNLYRMTIDYASTAKSTETIPLEVEISSDNRMGGMVSWQVILPPDCGFRFNNLENFTLSCEVSSSA